MSITGKKWSIMIVIAVLLLIPSAANTTNITISDGYGSKGLGQGGEDQEVEPGCFGVAGCQPWEKIQDWDLEAVIWNPPIVKAKAGKLVIIGGWNFVDGVRGSPRLSGDLFVSLNGQGPLRDNPGAKGNWGYDLVFDLDWPAIGGKTASGTLIDYILRDINSPGIVLSNVIKSANEPTSNPYRWVSGGKTIGQGKALFKSYPDDNSINKSFAVDLEGDKALTGGRHYSLMFDYSPPKNTSFWTHFTQNCGNDNLMGHFSFFDSLGLGPLSMSAPGNAPIQDTVCFSGLGSLGSGQLLMSTPDNMTIHGQYSVKYFDSRNWSYDLTGGGNFKTPDNPPVLPPTTPEPSSLILLGLGITALLMRKRLFTKI